MIATPVTSPMHARLGKGARLDAPGAPTDTLRLARHGMSFFARHLNALSDEVLTGPSRVPAWSRAHVVAHVSIEARAQALAFAALRGQLPDDDFDWTPDVTLTATLPPRALRHLFEHAHVHVNVEWRDLPSAGWDGVVSGAAARDLPLRQAERLWWGAVALNAAATPDDVPTGLGVPKGPLQALSI